MESNETDGPPGCGSRLRTECCGCSGWFTIYEGTKTLDIPATFSNRHFIVRIVKVIFFLWAASIIGVEVARYPYRGFYFAFLTNIVHVFQVIYFFMSCVNSLCPTKQPQPSPEAAADDPDEKHPNLRPSFWICLTWIMSMIVLNLSVEVTAMFWAVVYIPGTPISYAFVMQHGGLMLLIIIDVLLLNRVPVRWKHWIFPFIVNLLYFIWSIIHPFTGIGNPINPNSDLIYETMDWRGNWQRTLVIAIIILLGISPVTYAICWIASLYSCPCGFSGQNRRYVLELNYETNDLQLNNNTNSYNYDTNYDQENQNKDNGNIELQENPFADVQDHVYNYDGNGTYNNGTGAPVAPTAPHAPIVY